MYDLIDPAAEEVLCSVAMAGLEETGEAIPRAHDASAAGRAVSPGGRGRLLRSFAVEVDAYLDELAELEVRNAGHPVNARC